jgi:hypothetical protein
MMNKRPLSVTIISIILLAAGLIGLAYHGAEVTRRGPFRFDLFLVFLIRLLAVVGAVYMLRARNWARWLLVIWIAGHVILSAFHSPAELTVHGLLFLVVAYFLFRPPAVAYFRHEKVTSEQENLGSTTR